MSNLVSSEGAVVELSEQASGPRHLVDLEQSAIGAADRDEQGTLIPEQGAAMTPTIRVGE
jgi:hypothetical protein